MKKIAIVGVEGSGKTVMLACLGELYSHPDEDGYFLSPKNFTTMKYVCEKIAKLRHGEWPTATAEDVMQGLDWTLKRQSSSARPENVCELSCLDFAGEVYRRAFCSESSHNESEEEKALKKYVDDCDDLIVLINLRDVITTGLGDPRVQQSQWVTNAILNYALAKSKGGEAGKQKRAAIVLAQSDSYFSTIDRCGGPAKTLEAYLPHVYNNYGWLDIFEACSVDRIRVDDDGNIFPHPDFKMTYLKGIVDWIKQGIAKKVSVNSTLATVDSVQMAFLESGCLKDNDLYINTESTLLSSLQSGKSIPQTKLRNALRSYAQTIKEEQVLCLYDATVFGGAKEGFIITTVGIFSKSLFAYPRAFPWGSVMNIGQVHGSLRIDGTDVCPAIGEGVFILVQKLNALFGCAPEGEAMYCVVDLSGGPNASFYPVEYMDEEPDGGFNTPEYKTTKLVLKRVEAGSFVMGNAKEEDNQPHSVVLTKPFYLGIYEVTQKQWERVMGTRPSYFSGDANPVESVSYDMICGSCDGAKWPASDAVDDNSFLGCLRRKTNINFGLPTEAQWEYACRAGTTTRYSCGNIADGDYMWFDDNSGSLTHEVGTRKPNWWGFYDMHGNVWEWCRDWYAEELSMGTDPRGSSSGSGRVLRGGSCSDNASYCTSSLRNSCGPSRSDNDIGFRLSRTLP